MFLANRNSDSEVAGRISLLREGKEPRCCGRKDKFGFAYEAVFTAPGRCMIRFPITQPSVPVIMPAKTSAT